jgi:hypothetical protein
MAADRDPGPTAEADGTQRRPRGAQAGGEEDEGDRPGQRVSDHRSSGGRLFGALMAFVAPDVEFGEWDDLEDPREDAEVARFLDP